MNWMWKLMIVSSFMMPQSSFGALPPSVYRKAQARSSHVMVIRVQRLLQYRYVRNRLYIKARVKVLSEKRGSRWIKRHRWITIRYQVQTSSRHGMFGAAPIPVLKKNHVYKAYLNRDRHSRYYTPSAGSRSFMYLY